MILVQIRLLKEVLRTMYTMQLASANNYIKVSRCGRWAMGDGWWAIDAVQAARLGLWITRTVVTGETTWAERAHQHTTAYKGVLEL